MQGLMMHTRREQSQKIEILKDLRLPWTASVASYSKSKELKVLTKGDVTRAELSFRSRFIGALKRAGKELHVASGTLCGTGGQNRNWRLWKTETYAARRSGIGRSRQDLAICTLEGGCCSKRNTQNPTGSGGCPDPSARLFGGSGADEGFETVEN